MSELHARLRADLLTARKSRDAMATSVLRSTLSAIANAEAQPAPEGALATEGPIAGAVSGLGAAEAVRRDLGEQDVRDVISGEQTERLAAARELESHGVAEKAEQLRAEAELLAGYL